MAETRKIGILGAGFSGVLLASYLAQFHSSPLEIFLYDKTGRFGVGDAYRTPYDYHLLNGRTKEMSAFEHDEQHFVNWLKNKNYNWDANVPVEEQFAPRNVYRDYLQDLVKKIAQYSHVKLHLIPAEVVDVDILNEGYLLKTTAQEEQHVDKIVLAVGNQQPMHWSYQSSAMQIIANPWDYEAIGDIDPTAAVLIVGTGLSMVDAVLTLHHRRHVGSIYSVSRRGLLPLPHAQHANNITIAKDTIPSDLRSLTQYIRSLARQQVAHSADWRSVMTALRPNLSSIWRKLSISDKQRFLRHAISYWNIHRHRINPAHADLLRDLIANKKLKIFKGKLLDLHDEEAHIQLRNGEIQSLKLNTLINCTGPSLYVNPDDAFPFLQALLNKNLAILDELRLGLVTSEEGALHTQNGVSRSIFAIGPIRKGVDWEATAVPELRKQVATVARELRG